MIAEQYRKEIDAVRAAAVDAWRAAAGRLAEDNTPPKAADIYEIAATLGIRDPGRVLEADVEALRAMNQFLSNAAVCRADKVALLKPWGGNIENVRVAAAAAQAEADRLKAEYDRIDGSGSLGYWVNAIDDLKAEVPRLFADDYRRSVSPLDVEASDAAW